MRAQALRLACTLLLFVAGCAPAALSPLVLEGPELHATLTTRKLEDAAVLQLAGVLMSNPQLSSDSGFVDMISRIGSQDRMRGQGVRTALYALYKADVQLGLYGFEAATQADADRIEGVLRDIWSHNESLDRTRVHRAGRVFAVVWHDGVSPECWQAANARVLERLHRGRADPR